MTKKGAEAPCESGYASGEEVTKRPFELARSTELVGVGVVLGEALALDSCEVFVDCGTEGEKGCGFTSFGFDGVEWDVRGHERRSLR